jgi:hypothetical protein
MGDETICVLVEIANISCGGHLSRSESNHVKQAVILILHGYRWQVVVYLHALGVLIPISAALLVTCADDTPNKFDGGRSFPTSQQRATSASLTRRSHQQDWSCDRHQLLDSCCETERARLVCVVLLLGRTAGVGRQKASGLVFEFHMY